MSKLRYKRQGSKQSENSLQCLDFDVFPTFKGTDTLLQLAFWHFSNMGHCFSKDKSDGSDSEQAVEFVGGNVHRVTSKEDWDQKLSEAKRDGKIVIANFSATWCGPCRMLAPFYCELSEKHPSLMFLLIDVDELTDFSTSWDIKATPTFFFLKDGQQIDKLVGANKPELQKKLTAVLDSVGNHGK
ncbi:thioredoxin H9-like isoform X1 [Gossypium arboreum]|uniref:thioredoxin H9-like isoform X1 n=1 Tax=Gossypium arboreum TaxID=29729 RepID=UPI0022F1C8CC|nr:thioredoxin H9-like isoform X1 [Gossypium arboreum]